MIDARGREGATARRSRRAVVEASFRSVRPRAGSPGPDPRYLVFFLTSQVVSFVPPSVPPLVCCGLYSIFIFDAWKL